MKTNLNRVPSIFQMPHVAVMLCAIFTLSLDRSSAAGQDANGAAAALPALKGLDPIALVSGKEIAGDSARTVTRNGYVYSFASSENKSKFEDEPARYEIQLGGRCGAMTDVIGDPNLFAVVGGKIYIFGSPTCREAFVSAPEKFLAAKKNVAVFVHEGVELLDFAGPAEVFDAADQGRGFNVYTVASSADDIVSQGFLTVKPQYTLDNCPPPDLIVLPGGNTDIPLADKRVIEWIQKNAAEGDVVMSVCTGAFLLAKAGLLDGKEATTHWGSIDSLRQYAPKTKVHADRRVVDNGQIVTCAGVSAGIDGALHLVQRMLGDEAAKQTARYMEYRWEPIADEAR